MNDRDPLPPGRFPWFKSRSKSYQVHTSEPWLGYPTLEKEARLVDDNYTAFKSYMVSRSFVRSVGESLSKNIRILSHLDWFIATAIELTKSGPMSDTQSKLLRLFCSVATSVTDLMDSSLHQRASLILSSTPPN